MKKSLIFAGMLVVGFANAQYEGRVGVNTETPSATFNVKSKTGNNATTKNFELENADGAKMVTVLDNGYVGFGTDNPEYRFEIIGETIGYTGGAMAFKNFRENSGSGALDFYKARGTYANPTSVKLMDKLGGMNFMAYNGKDYIPSASVFAQVIGRSPDNSIKDDFVRTRLVLGIYSIEKSTQTVNYKEVLSVYQDAENEEKHRAYIDGLATISSLKGNIGMGERPVYAKEDGTLIIGEVNTGATTLTGEENLQCNEANRGKMNFVKDVTIGTGKGDAFAVCLKGTDGKFYWRYLYGAGGVSNLEGNFGTGLQ